MTRMINENTGMIDDDTGMINEETGKIIVNESIENTVNGRRKHSKERSKDTKPRNFPLHTMKNLPRFRDKSHEELRQYILEKKGVDIGSNFAWSKAITWILIGLVIVVCGIGIARLWKEKE